MKSPASDSHRLFVINGAELPLSGAALLELMQAVFARGMPFRFRARGWSMAPFIRDGDVISVSPRQQTPARTGQVVAFIHPETGKLVVHRVIGKRDNACLIQGDNVPDGVDGLIPEASVLGRVTRVERGGRSVWLGLGPERYAIAYLSRTGMLVPIIVRIAPFLRPFLRRSTQ